MFEKLMEYLANASFAKKINLITLPALITITAFALILISNNISDLKDANLGIKDAHIVTVMDNLAHNYAVERGLTAGYLGSKGTTGYDKLKDQRALADKATQQFNSLYENIYETSSKAVQNTLDDINRILKKIPSVREKVNRLSPNSQAFQTYSELNKYAINSIELVSVELKNAELVKELNALINVLWLKERAGQERGLLNGIFARSGYTSQQVNRAIRYESEQQSRSETLSRILPIEFIALSDKINQSEAAKQVQSYRQDFKTAVNQASMINAKSADWFPLATSRIKDIKNLSNALIADIQAKTNRQQNSAITALVAEITVLLILYAGILFTGTTIKNQLRMNISKMSLGFEHIRKHKDFSYRLDIQSEDELGQSAIVFDALMEQLESVISQVNDSLSSMARGNFENKITLELQGDLLTLKSSVNQSIDKVRFTMFELEAVMNALEQGNFEARMSEEIEGQFRDKVDTAMMTLDKAMNEVSSVVVSMSEGNFSNRVTLPLNGTLNSLKNSINSSASIVEGAVQEISSVLSTQSEGDFSVRVVGQYQGQLDILKQTINKSVASIDSAVSAINHVFKSLAKGDFTTRVNTELMGDLNTMKQGINFTLDQVSEAITEILSVTEDQAKGILDKQVEGEFEGQLKALKQSVNHAGSTIQNVVDTIAMSMTKLNKGDFSSQIDQKMEGSFNDLKSDFNTSMKSLGEVIREIKNVSAAQSEGDLSLRIKDGYMGDLKDIAFSINSSLDRVSTIVDQIKSSGDSTLVLARKQASSSDSISRRTESQASSLQQIAATMEELTTSVQQNSQEVTSAESQVDKIKDASLTCQDSIRITVEKMDSIRKSSASMETFTNLIDEISFQTNLLALNAAVEAARAGTHGKGFAVVAAEVRNLAQRSAQAAKEIKALIADNDRIVDQGYEAIRESSDQIHDISSAIKQTGELVKNINLASMEQARGLQEVNAAITQLDSDTQHNTTMLENTSMAAKSVEEQAFEVNKSLSFFTAANQTTQINEQTG